MSEKIVIVNQAANYLTVGYANAFTARGVQVVLMTGSVHEQGEALDPSVQRVSMVHWRQRPKWKKAVAYLAFLAQAWFLLVTRYRKYDVLFISIPPMAHVLSLIVPNRCSVLVWDVYPDMLRVIGMSRHHWLYRFLAGLNRRAYARCQAIMTITEPMRELLSEYTDTSKITVVPIWSTFQGIERVSAVENKFLEENEQRQDRFIVQYSGNLGISHNAEVLLDLAELLEDDPRILIQIIGRGPRELAIKERVRLRGLGNVEMLPFQSDERFIHSLSAADIGVVALNEKVSQGSVPSKAYNLMAFSIPALYIVAPDSELARYAHMYKSGEIFDSKDTRGMEQYVRHLRRDTDSYKKYQEGARYASKFFRRRNADVFVDQFLEERL